MQAHELAELGKVNPNHPGVAVGYVLSHALRDSDASQLVNDGEAATTRLGQLAALSDRAWALTTDASVPLALMGVREWSAEPDGTPSALLWSVSHPDLEEPMPELLETIGPILSEIAAAYPALWTWKLPTDRPEALPRWNDEQGFTANDFILVGPGPAPLSTGWLDHFAAERN